MIYDKKLHEAAIRSQVKMADRYWKTAQEIKDLADDDFLLKLDKLHWLLSDLYELGDELDKESASGIAELRNMAEQLHDTLDCEVDSWTF